MKKKQKNGERKRRDRGRDREKQIENRIIERFLLIYYQTLNLTSLKVQPQKKTLEVVIQDIGQSPFSHLS